VFEHVGIRRRHDEVGYHHDTDIMRIHRLL
jgi:hypothetical protein